MSTSSSIAVKREDGKYVVVYCNKDGYINGVGKTLVESYNSYDKAIALVSMGSISSLNKSMEMVEGHSFENRVEGFTVFYNRDRGEELEVGVFDTYRDLLREYDFEFNYVFLNGVWLNSMNVLEEYV